MDLQAILDAPSSSSSEDFPYSKYNVSSKHSYDNIAYRSTSDEYSNNYKSTSYEDGLSDISSAIHDECSVSLPNGPSFRESYRCGGNGSYDSEDIITSITKGGRSSNNLELERILRDDDDDDDDEVNNSEGVSNSAKKKVRGRDSDILHSILNEEDDENSRDENDSFAKYSTTRRQSDSIYSMDKNSDLHLMGQPTTIPPSHSMEVDAILDSVNDDDDEELPSENEMNSSYWKYNRMMTNATSDEEDEEGIGLNFNFSKGDNNAAYENISTQYPLSRGVPSHEEEQSGPQIYLNGGKQSILEGEQSLKDYTTNFLHRRNAKPSPGKDAGNNVRDTTELLPTSLSEDQQNEQISNKCLHSAELYEHRLLKPNNRNLVSPLTVKRRMKPKVTLKSKSRMSQPAASTQQPQSQPRFGFSGGIIQVKSMADLSTHIVKSNARQNVHQRDFQEQAGLPTTMAVNSKFIAVGTQHGEVWIFDLFEQLKMTLGAEESTTGVGNNKKVHAVTSIDLPLHGDYLLAGYGSGAIVLWDVIKGVVLKGMYDLHSSPITSVRLTSFPIAYSGGNDSDIGAVSVDASGLVSKIVFSRGILWSSYSAETECLLDGTAGQILAMDTLPPLDQTQYSDAVAMEYHPSAYKIVLIALSSDRSSFAVSVYPKVSVLHRWARPAASSIDPSAVDVVDDGVSDITLSHAPTYGTSSVAQYTPKKPEKLPFLPCLSWGWGLVSGGKNSVTPILARSWGCCIQFLCANFPPRDEDPEPDDGTIHWPAFGLLDEFNTTAPVVSLNWLGTRSLVYLTLSNEFTIIDTVIMTMQERLDFSGMKLV